MGTDLQLTATTPNFALITPDMCDDMHDCSIQNGDAWLQQQVPNILGSPAFTAQHSLLVITWDEDDGSSANQVATLFLGPNAARAGATSSAGYNHYSLLHTIEAALGLSTLNPNDAGAPLMSDMLGAAAPAPPPVPHSWTSLYSLEAFGGIHPIDGSAALTSMPGFTSPVARTIKAAPGAAAASSGLVLDGFGGIHPYGAQPAATQYPYFPNFDIARDLVFLPDATGGYMLDGFGGIHPFSIGSNPLPPQPDQYPYFPGRDVAKKIWLLPDASGGYVLDSFGGLHPWSVSGHPLPTPMAEYGYWPNQNIARDIWFMPGTSASSGSGYVLDAFGGFHPFWSATASRPPDMAQYGYWYGQDIARSMWFMPGSSTAGYTLDCSGGIHPFSAPGQALPATPSQYAYWPGQDIARALVGA